MTEIDLTGLISGANGEQSEVDATRRRAFGVSLGVVTNIDDPEGLARVKVSLPWLSDCVESAWARIALPWAGQNRGSYFAPEVGDEVLVSFRHGDLGHPYIVGFLWSADDPPPEPSPRLERRELKSKSGHTFVFDDTKAHESITIRSQGNREIRIDDATETISIRNAARTVEIRVDARNGGITITSQSGNIAVRAPAGEVAIQGQRVRVNASTRLVLQGATVDINPPEPGAFPLPSEGGGAPA